VNNQRRYRGVAAVFRRVRGSKTGLVPRAPERTETTGELNPHDIVPAGRFMRNSRRTTRARTPWAAARWREAPTLGQVAPRHIFEKQAHPDIIELDKDGTPRRIAPAARDLRGILKRWRAALRIAPAGETATGLRPATPARGFCSWGRVHDVF